MHPWIGSHWFARAQTTDGNISSCRGMVVIVIVIYSHNGNTSNNSSSNNNT